MKNLPNVLTISRIVLLAPLLIMIYLPNDQLNLISVILFILIALTDFFDGFFARRQNITSEFGKMLDPIADKLLVVGVLIVLMIKGTIEDLSILPALLIIFREIFISGLREFAANRNSQASIDVSQVGKLKTAIQMLSLLLILSSLVLKNLIILLNIGIIFLWISMLLALISGYKYYKSVFN
mgnify:FL=1|tara:strand:+ start:69 stop:614 length:546 start_codon:yes stop_codon:yes gene_type:complete